MFSRPHLLPACLLLVLAIAAGSGTRLHARQVDGTSPHQAAPAAQPLPDAQIKAEAQTLITNQHRDDDALEQYERVERHTTRTSTSRLIDDKTYRVLPTGSGTMKVLLKDGDTPVSLDMYRQELQQYVSLLQIMVRPTDPKAATAYEKFRKRQQERARLVDAMRYAFIPKPLPSEILNGHRCDVFQLDPDPAFHPHSIFEETLVHVAAKLWVDHDAQQLVRGEAHVVSDFPVGAGLLGKLYKGGSFAMDQEPVAPGIWLPTRYRYDFTGRKFFFPFEQHQTITASRYGRVGLPKDALLLVQNELASGKPFVEDP